MAGKVVLQVKRARKVVEVEAEIVEPIPLKYKRTGKAHPVL
jgi:hypothetical protein